ncbi:MAG: DUF2202 domain-containing protein [Microbacter sp.]
MKTKMNRWMMLGFLVSSVLMLTSCTQQDALNPQKTTFGSVIQVASDGTTTVSTDNLLAAFAPTASLTDAELTTLLKMKEEEKLARDVYTALNLKWGKPIFSNIANAEQRHMEAVITLLKFYNQPDTLIADPGVFTFSAITQLYQSLVATGSISLADAYKIGLQIEEMDIKDLTDALAANPNANIVMTFENLLKGSRNHLRAFNKQYTALGLVYVPQYISQDAFNAIVQSAMEQGSQYALQNHYRYNYQYQYQHQFGNGGH